MNHIEMQKPQRENVSDDFIEPVMEEQVRDNKAWYFLLFAVVDELVSHNLRYSTIRGFCLFRGSSRRLIFDYVSVT